MSRVNKEACAELDLLRAEHGGTVSPVQVLAFAKNKKTALHKLFIWDNTEAAERFRLLQAGAILRAYVIVPSEGKPAMRAYVSLASDRDNGRSGNIGAGVRRHIDDVMSDDILRAEYLRNALMDLRAIRRKYESIKELAEVWAAADRVEANANVLSNTELRVSA